MNTNNENRIVQPYLFFDGQCDEALEFYRKALGAEILMLTRFKESPAPPQPGCPPSPGDKVMHASFRIGKTNKKKGKGGKKKNNKKKPKKWKN